MEEIVKKLCETDQPLEVLDLLTAFVEDLSAEWHRRIATMSSQQPETEHILRKYFPDAFWEDTHPEDHIDGE